MQHRKMGETKNCGKIFRLSLQHLLWAFAAVVAKKLNVTNIKKFM
jgi:xanthine/uracil permease